MGARKGLSRLAAVYTLVEQRRSVELRAAVAAVEEAARAIAEEQGSQRTETALGLAALAAGDREGWLIAEAICDLAALHTQRLDAWRVEREAALAEAALVHRESYAQKEQLARVLERSRAASELEGARRDQAEVDDRYAARLSWRRMKTR